jgi:hypothetical protein
MIWIRGRVAKNRIRPWNQARELGLAPEECSVPFPNAVPLHNIGCQMFLDEFLLWINMVIRVIREKVSVLG